MSLLGKNKELVNGMFEIKNKIKLIVFKEIEDNQIK